MYSEKELSQLIGEVEKEFSSFLAKAESDEMSLSKAEDSEKEAKPEAKDEKEEKPEQKEESEAPAQAEAAAPSEEAPSEEMPPVADEAQAAAPEEGHGYDDEDVAHMDAMYSSMSKPELIAHHDSVKRALDAMSAQDQQAQAPADEAQALAAPMMKSETDTVIEVKPEIVKSSEETDLLKSELAAKDAEVSELKKTLEAVTAFVTKLVEKKAAPQGKAITQLDTIAKSEPEQEVKTLTQKEITAKLSQKASEPTLQKSDREAINQYYATGQININGISHLLK